MNGKQSLTGVDLRRGIFRKEGRDVRRKWMSEC